MQADEVQVAMGGVYGRRMGCLLLPFLPVRAAAALVVTTRRIVIDPIFHYKLFVRKVVIDVGDVERAEVSGSGVELNIWDFVSIGRALDIRLKNGKVYNFRSTAADQLAEAINRVVSQLRG